MRKISLSILIFISMGTIYAQNTDCLFMIEQAIKAPSGHNAQPWLFKINDNNIEIHPNFDRSLPVVDPDNRELFISLGCATENLCIAATHKGYSSNVDIAENGIITIYLTRDELVIPDPLFKSIEVRQTNRSVYNGEIVPTDTLDLFNQNPVETGVNIRFYKNGTQEFDSISSYVIEGNIIQMHDKAFTGELKSWMRFNKKHQNRTNDGLSYAVFGAPNMPMFIVKPIMSGYLNANKQNKKDVKKMHSSSHFVLFTTQSNTLENWINLGRTLERFLLKLTELNIIHAYLNQPNEVSTLSEKMIDTLNIHSEYPTILLRIGYGEPMPYSKRLDINNLVVK